MQRSLKDVIKNLFFSFFSYAMPLAVLQFVIQPIIAKKLGAELNGQYLTLMSANYFLIGITAAVLNTVRMLQHEKYRQGNYVGDFNIFFSAYVIVILIVMPVLMICYTGCFDLLDILLYAVIGLLYLYHDYIFAQYWLELNYNKILINNAIIVVGYFVGLPLFLWTGKWQLIIITAYTFSSVYDYFNTTFLREPIRRTPLLKETGKKVLYYTGAQVLSSFITYCDKLLLYPLLGGVLVSVYNTASMVGKLLLLLSSPLKSVMLGYLVKMETLQFKLRRKWLVLMIAGLGVVYFACLIVGFPLTSLLYPDWASESQKYLVVTVLASLLALLADLLNTVAIRFLEASFQIKLQAINLGVYLALCLSLLYFFSLWGFCIGVAASALVRVAILAVIIIKYYKKQNFSEKA
ncbi:MAG: hypothetical protein E7470_02050 [Ruminococcaceae bacterium]|nr:hypothetical protein [Oscillospiraceae bacterium]